VLQILRTDKLDHKPTDLKSYLCGRPSTVVPRNQGESWTVIVTEPKVPTRARSITSPKQRRLTCRRRTRFASCEGF